MRVMHGIPRASGRAQEVPGASASGASAPVMGFAATWTRHHVQLIKDCCARYAPLLATWIGSVRDRLFFAVCEDTGIRLGEALCLQHRDWHSRQGEKPLHRSRATGSSAWAAGEGRDLPQTLHLR